MMNIPILMVLIEDHMEGLDMVGPVGSRQGNREV
jgi:hypothetical protein